MDVKIEGMSCAGCSSSVEREVSKIKGVTNCSVNLILGSAHIEHDLKNDEIIIKTIEKLGFKVSREIKFDDKKDKKDKYKKYKNKFIISSFFTVILLYISMGSMLYKKIPMPSVIDMNENPLNFAIIQLVLATIVMIIGRNFYKSAIKKIKNPNMDVLVSVGTLSAYIYSLYSLFKIFNGDLDAVHNLYFESSATIITLILLGKTLETKALSRTSKAIEKLMELTPDEAMIIDENKTQKIVNINEVKIGDVLIVKPGSKIPVDGTVIEGKTYIDESMLTGESMPVSKKKGENVSAGTINQNGTIYIKALNVSSQTLLAKIIKFVEDANATKAPIAKLADIISGKFVPIVILIATVSAICWLGHGIEFSLTIFVSVLVIACPCALGLATPTAIMVATGRSASLGILFKNSESLELTHKASKIVFDKTGTITKGVPTVVDVLTYDITKEDLMKIVYSAELLSEHPIAKAICNSFKNSKEVKITNFKALIGKGIECTYKKDKVFIGKCKSDYDIEKYAKEGKTVVGVYINDKLTGIITIADTIRNESKKLIKELKNLGLEVYMLTGDNEITASSIAKKVGIDNVIANVLPEEKAKKIQELQNDKNVVIMVGDGINDAPALSVSDIAIAVSSGTDIAMECSDIVILNNNITTIITAIKLSHKTLSNIKTNLFFAFIYNIICIPIACGVLYVFNGPILNPMMAAFAMSLSSVSVVSNALRLRFVKLK